MSIRLVDFDTHAAQVANDLFYLLIGEAAGLYEDEGVDWTKVEAVVQRQPEGTSLYGIIAREFDAYNMVTFGVIEINSRDDYEAMEREIARLRASWESQFGYPHPSCACGTYAVAPSGLL